MATPTPRVTLPALDLDKDGSAKHVGKDSKTPRSKNAEQQKGKSPRSPVHGERSERSQFPERGAKKQKGLSVTSKTPVSDVTIKSPRAESDRTHNHSRETRAAPKTKASSRNETPVSRRSWVTYNSPLWRKDRVKTEEELSHSMPTTPRVLTQMEGGFVNDAIVTHVYSNRRNPIIPPYDARSDKFAQAYFKSPFVQGIMERNSSLSMTSRVSSNASVANLKEIKMSKTINKLSVRRRCKPTPDVNSIRERETAFVNDAIITEKKRTKYKDIIKPYDAANDQLCKDYFGRRDIKKLVKQTCAPRPVNHRTGVMTLI